jgi:hypothetical protein
MEFTVRRIDPEICQKRTQKRKFSVAQGHPIRATEKQSQSR